MAYISQEMKQKIASRLKAEFPKWSFRLKIIHHSKVRVSIVRADVDFLAIAQSHRATLPVNSNRYHREYVSGFEVYGDLKGYFGDNQEAIEKMQKVIENVNLVGDEKDANFDESDSMTDYFHVGYYTSIRVGGETESTKFQYAP